jgi:hypothetical protein
MKNEIDLQRQDLDRQHSRLAEDEMLIPFVKSLKAYGATAEILLPFLSAVHEKALIRNIDLKTSAEQFIQELKSYRQLGTLQRSVELTEQRLTALDNLTTEKQHAITTLLNLKSIGYSENAKS